jgi:hypothetical protein
MLKTFVGVGLGSFGQIQSVVNLVNQRANMLKTFVGVGLGSFGQIQSVVNLYTKLFGCTSVHELPNGAA